MTERDTNTILEERGYVAAGHVQWLNLLISTSSHSHTGEFSFWYILVCMSFRKLKAQRMISLQHSMSDPCVNVGVTVLRGWGIGELRQVIVGEEACPQKGWKAWWEQRWWLSIRLGTHSLSSKLQGMEMSRQMLLGGGT